MTRRDWPRALPAAVLGIVCVLLVFAAVRGPKSWSPPDPEGAAERLAAAESQSEPAYEPPPQSAFTIVVDRNLFSVTRTPPPAPAVSNSGGSAESQDLVLVGSVATGEQAVAILEDKRDGSMLRLAVGETYRGWTLLELDARSARLRRDGEEVTLSLVYSEEKAGIPETSPLFGGQRRLPIEPRRSDGQGNPVPALRQNTVDERQRELDRQRRSGEDSGG